MRFFLNFSKCEPIVNLRINYVNFYLLFEQYVIQLKKFWFSLPEYAFGAKKPCCLRGEKMGTNLLILAEIGTGALDVLFVCGMGVGVVFLGLVCIIGLVELMTFLCNKLAKPQKSAPAAAAVQSAVPSEIPDRQEIIAAVCAAVAEENGTDISAIRVLSFKEIK